MPVYEKTKSEEIQESLLRVLQDAGVLRGENKIEQCSIDARNHFDYHPTFDGDIPEHTKTTVTITLELRVK